MQSNLAFSIFQFLNKNGLIFSDKKPVETPKNLVSVATLVSLNFFFVEFMID